MYRVSTILYDTKHIFVYLQKEPTVVYTLHTVMSDTLTLTRLYMNSIIFTTITTLSILNNTSLPQIPNLIQHVSFHLFHLTFLN